MPIRQVSNEQVEVLERERERMENIRLRMEMQKYSDRHAGSAAANASGHALPARASEDR